MLTTTFLFFTNFYFVFWVFFRRKFGNFEKWKKVLFENFQFFHLWALCSENKSRKNSLLLKKKFQKSAIFGFRHFFGFQNGNFWKLLDFHFFALLDFFVSIYPQTAKKMLVRNGFDIFGWKPKKCRRKNAAKFFQKTSKKGVFSHKKKCQKMPQEKCSGNFYPF